MPNLSKYLKVMAMYVNCKYVSSIYIGKIVSPLNSAKESQNIILNGLDFTKKKKSYLHVYFLNFFMSEDMNKISRNLFFTNAGKNSKSKIRPIQRLLLWL